MNEKRDSADSRPRRYRTIEEFRDTFYHAEQMKQTTEEQSASFGKQLARDIIKKGSDQRV
jgi:hypothetical protein